jgi:hypothetical protein
MMPTLFADDTAKPKVHTRKDESVAYIPPRNHVHSFRFNSPEELDPEVLACLRKAQRVGQQLHLSKREDHRKA